MTELLLHMNSYSIIGAIIAYQTYPKWFYGDRFARATLTERGM